VALLEARHALPHAVLGMHPIKHKRNQGVVVRAFLAGATACEVVELDAQPPKSFPMTRLAVEGIFEVFIPKRLEVFRYQFRAAYPNGELRQFYDPYCFLPTVGEQDLYLFNEGNEPPDLS